jgi:hypothetical protein
MLSILNNLLFDECHYAKRRHAECCGAKFAQVRDVTLLRYLSPT